MTSERSHAAYRAPDNVAWIDGAALDMGEELYLTRMPDGHSVLLAGSARLIWLVAAEGGDVLPGVAELVGMPPSEIADDVAQFLDDLVSRGLLTRDHRPSRNRGEQIPMQPTLGGGAPCGGVCN
ncbi:PqqD family protein [Tessaracoccus flavus]|uniref:Uncharacterized protein n=1 Tax=Tessaracoccus flavus TaxID=1610493 RepID=A0A1Q2CI32_9ACTN|nr:PqqD family protein [Tessaracoccus flavus]AQP45772.1 hypothetical protein RPIT_13970 [Tessaracoccus flavus]SDZ11573.1 hypothetical protein SAMN05428934_1114 [Tessaracoccus flavus]